MRSGRREAAGTPDPAGGVTGRGLRLFQALGFDARVDYPWLIVFLLILWTFTLGVFPRSVSGLEAVTYLAIGAVGTLPFFASIVAHELPFAGHA